ncbi:MAG: Uma2 family endonuclease [Gomphosphaeria aponina SAG 52.96 = DSM 107014]|uniref:Uma2 family endonuclease n=1 Tax=Gomphosphaeria aponina SAG 52.96 = DSM 107014 TaxID=1521640 RepID=A0A941JL60_9CHRO|nr:Uma2 family endonuclease [Gomphosphaeria aponina SAG 52.96 = DSM 107014]
MTQTSSPVTSPPPTSPSEKFTFEEYLFYQDNSDTRYELFRGKLIPMPTPTALHTDICKFLVYQFQRHFARANLSLVAVKNVGVRTEIDSSRIPDVILCTPQLWQQVRSRKGAGVLDFEEVPTLVVEVTSENWRDDYIRKRAEYAMIDIPEYWIVDANKQRVRILTQPEKEDGYEHTDFLPGQEIRSRQFPELVLSVAEILSPPIVEDLIKAEQTFVSQLEEQVSEERQRAETERQRADRLAAMLRERGIDPDSFV